MLLSRLFSVARVSSPRLLDRASFAASASLSTLACRRPCHQLQPIRRPISTSGGAALSGVKSHDAKLSSLLDSELRFERAEQQKQLAMSQQQQKQLAKPPRGFSVTQSGGTQFTLTRQCPDDGSLLEVSFDLNGSTAASQDELDTYEEPAAASEELGNRKPDRADGEDDDEEEILSRPDLTFRVRKPASATCLTVRCSFPPVHVSRQMATDDPDYPSLSIDTVAVEGAEGDQLGEYELEADMLNEDLYRQLAEMLVQRGVTREFENALVEFCTAQEHNIYLAFLAEAKKFCDA